METALEIIFRDCSLGFRVSDSVEYILSSNCNICGIPFAALPGFLLLVEIEIDFP